MKLAATLLFAAALAVQAQTPDPLQFEVAIIKPTVDFNAAGLITHLPGERGYHGVNMLFRNYMMVAYQLRSDQISGPDWIDSDHFDMEGKADRTCTADELHLMLQHLLEDRFHLKLRRESREVSGYNLVIDAGGHKLADHDPSDHYMGPIFHGPGQHQAKNLAMQYFAFYLSEEIGQKVVDKTDLPGHYDFTVTWGANNPAMTIIPSAPGAPGSDALENAPQAQTPGLTVFEALRKQLGLRLDKAKVPGEHVVIEHIEKLSDN
jgi:uncharacterized protein (TIGR03435 family)